MVRVPPRFTPVRPRSPLSRRKLSLILIASLALTCTRAWAAEPSPHGDEFSAKPVPETIEFNRDVRPILSGKCFHCHGQDPESRKARLRLDSFAEATKDKNGLRAVVPGDLEESELVWRVLSTDPEEIMPPPSANHPLTPREVEILKRWIQQGAEYSDHWSFLPPEKVSPPDPQAHPVDGFIRQRLVEAGLPPAVRADPHTLVRRVALDLTGLPPDADEVRQFAADGSDELYGRMVDHFLSKPTFGEHWAVMWLDLARYADSSGFGSDRLRPNLWPWRDWVIRAFNENKPFDHFSIEQLAGDLLPNPTSDQLIATAFHRNTMTNTEGGTDAEEFRVAAVKDRLATTFQGWMGLTVGCAQCHTHKFDPITHDEYYQLFAVFNQTADANRFDEEPTLPLPTIEEGEALARIRAEMARLEAELQQTDEQDIWRELPELRAHALKPVPWRPAPIERIHSLSTAAPRVLPDGSARFEGTALTVTDSFTHEITGLTGTVTAVRIEALPDDTLPQGGPGLSATGNAVITHARVNLRRGPQRSSSVRYVRIVGDSTEPAVAAIRALDLNGADVAEGRSGIYVETSRTWELDLGAERVLGGLAVQPQPERQASLVGATLQLLDGQRRTLSDRKITAEALALPSFRLDNLVASATFAHATADYEQPGFAAAAVIDNLPETGWAFGGQTGRPHQLVLALATPLALTAGDYLEVSLNFDYGTYHLLGRYRLSVTDEEGPVFEVPPTVRAALLASEQGRDRERDELLLAYLRPLAEVTAPGRSALKAKQREFTAIQPLRVPIMRELDPVDARKTFLLGKGNYLSPEREVKPALLGRFGPIDSVQPNRLDAARWLFSPDNPLTARVSVNRFWGQLFGRGLVATQEDFGTQGALPTHPALLDWLALHFSRDLQWDVKALLRTIVMSETYRQSSVASAAAAQIDPRNELLSHYPRRRLTAEQIRDQALAFSGLLSPKQGGPSVFPPQPDGLWRAAFNDRERNWKTSEGEDRYRRALYTFWRRTMPYPSLTTFDAPSRETATFRRVPTNTPLQAFVTMNDPAFVEMARALGRRLHTEGGETTEARVRYGLNLVLSRPPAPAQIEPLVDFHREQTTAFAADPEAALALLGARTADAGTEPTSAEEAAWVLLANVLLNLDGVLTIH